jgi:sugar lactone lactonase YvrE
MRKLYLLSLSSCLLLSGAANAQRAEAGTQLPGVTTLAGLAASKTKSGLNGQGAAARFRWPMGIAVDASGTVYVADEEDNTIRKITSAGNVTTLAGSPGTKNEHADGLGPAAHFYHPVAVAVDASGTLYVTDADNNTIRKISPAGQVTTLAGVAGHKGHADGAPTAAQFNCPHGVAVAASGTVYVADTFNHTIRKIDPAGQVTTLAGVAGSKGSIDGTGAQARLSYPSGIAVDAAGTVYVVDNGAYTIRKITAAGVVTTLAGLAHQKGSTDGVGSAARFHAPNGLAVGPNGVLYVAEYINCVIRQITPRGEVSTFAGVFKGWASRDGSLAEAGFDVG